MARLPGLVGLALRTVRANPLHTFLSTLGLIIGVAALVGVLALGDGLERYARSQLATTTSLHAVVVTPQTAEQIDGVYLRREDVPAVMGADADALAARVGAAADVVLTRSGAVGLRALGDTARSAAYLQAVRADVAAIAETAGLSLRHGRFVTLEETRAGAAVVMVNDVLGGRLGGGDAAAAVGRTAAFGDVEAEIVGVFAGPPAETAPRALGPLGAFDAAIAGTDPPTLVLNARAVEDVPAIADTTRAWLDDRYADGRGAFRVVTNETRVEQVRRGARLFKLVMGLITGISVVVGGVGVMNVLLIAVTERTREIGIRKAVGARRGDVVAQFLTEAVAISTAGAAFGLVVGLAGIFAVVPLIRHLTDVPFQAAFSWGTVGVVAVVAVVVGVVFGTYPAYRAARLAPVDAIRQE